MFYVCKLVIKILKYFPQARNNKKFNAVYDRQKYSLYIHKY